MTDILYIPQYEHPAHDRPEDYRARGSPWTTGAPKRKHEDEFGPLPDLSELNTKPLRRGRVPNAAPTNRRLRAQTKLELTLEKEAQKRPDEAASIRHHLAMLRETHARKMEEIRKEKDFAIADLHSGRTAEALRETGVGERKIK
jgi:hypothetical protein